MAFQTFVIGYVAFVYLVMFLNLSRCRVSPDPCLHNSRSSRCMLYDARVAGSPYTSSKILRKVVLRLNAYRVWTTKSNPWKTRSTLPQILILNIISQAGTSGLKQTENPLLVTLQLLLGSGFVKSEATQSLSFWSCYCFRQFSRWLKPCANIGSGTDGFSVNASW